MGMKEKKAFLRSQHWAIKAASKAGTLQAKVEFQLSFVAVVAVPLAYGRGGGCN